MKVTEVIGLKIETDWEIPLYSCKIKAGFPAPADDHIESKQDLNKLLIKNPIATYFLRVSGDSMIEAGIHSGDILIVDRSVSAKDGSIVIAQIHDELTVKRFRKKGKQILLEAANPEYPSIQISPEYGLQIWGVVTFVIHKPC